MTGTLINNGVDLMFEANETSIYAPVNITLGPLSYKYTVSQIKFHFGSWDGMGSEHSVNGEWFDGEVGILSLKDRPSYKVLATYLTHQRSSIS